MIFLAVSCLVLVTFGSERTLNLCFGNVFGAFRFTLSLLFRPRLFLRNTAAKAPLRQNHPSGRG